MAAIPELAVFWRETTSFRAQAPAIPSITTDRSIAEVKTENLALIVISA
jgi:hypothetical protein